MGIHWEDYELNFNIERVGRMQWTFGRMGKVAVNFEGMSKVAAGDI